MTQTGAAAAAITPGFGPSEPILPPGCTLMIGPYDLTPGNPGPYELDAGLSLGDPAAITKLIESLVLDGDRQSGRRAGNRNLSIPMVITGNSAMSVDAAKSAMTQFLDQQSFLIQYVPFGGTVVSVVEVFRAQVATEYQPEQTGAPYEIHGRYVRALTVTAVGRPFIRGVNRRTLNATQSLTMNIDACDGDTATSSNGSTRSSGITVTLSYDTTHKQSGTASLLGSFTVPAAGGTMSVIRTDTFTNPTDFSAYQSLHGWIQGNSTGGALSYSPAFTLTDSSGATQTVGVTDTGERFNSQGETFGGLTSPLSSFSAVNLTAIKTFSFRLTATVAKSTATQTVLLNIDNLQSFGSFRNTVQVTHGGSYVAPAIAGDARTECALTITAAPSGNALGTLGSVIAYRNPPEAPMSYQPLVPLQSQADQVVYASASNPATRFDGTYHLFLGVHQGSSAAAMRGVTVTFTQFANIFDGSSRSDQLVVPHLYGLSDISDGLLDVGVVTLPIRELPDANTQGGFQIRVTGSDTSSAADTFTDLMLLDTRGPTLIVRNTLGANSIFVVEPDPTRGDSPVYAGASIAIAQGCWDLTTEDGGPFTLDGGMDNTFMVYDSFSTNGPPQVTIGYYPRTRGNQVYA